MRAISLLAPILISSPLALMGQGVVDFAQQLALTPQYRATATFEVLLPSAQDPVTYDVDLQSAMAQQPDSLAPCDYVIRWSTISPAGPLNGFSAYFDGNHYRYRNNRLQEYHFESNPEVFMPGGPGTQMTSGVHTQAQFADMLPQFVGQKLLAMAADSAYSFAFHPDTIVAGKRSIVVQGAKRSAGYDVMLYTYVFDHDTGLPRSFDFENSPGTISEQLVTITYGPATGDKTIAYTEQALIDEWPEVFEKFRQSTFRAESLIGNPLPQFSCHALGASDRVSHMRGEALSQPAIFAFLDPEVATSQATIEAVRQAASQLPMPVTVYWAVTTNHDAQAAELLGDLGPDETALMSASSLIRNCGITLFPTIMLVDSDSMVKDVVPGYNNDLASIVIQKAVLLR